jgi:hypothetical protein
VAGFQARGGGGTITSTNVLSVPEISRYPRQEIEGGVVIRYLVRQPGERDWTPVKEFDLPILLQTFPLVDLVEGRSEAEGFLHSINMLLRPTGHDVGQGEGGTMTKGGAWARLRRWLAGQ